MVDDRKTRIYVWLIKQKIRTIDEIPEEYRATVEALLQEME